MKKKIFYFKEWLLKAHIEFDVDVDLSVSTYMRTGGIASIMVFPRNTRELSLCMNRLNDISLIFKVIGNTSNLLFLDDVEYTCLVSTGRMCDLVYDSNNKCIEAGAGVLLPDLSRKALYESIVGFEGLEGIPGTVGGGVVMNAGAYGYELKDTLVECEVVHPDGSVKVYKVEELQLKYRSSILRQNDNGRVVSKCYFKGSDGKASDIYRRMELFHAKRHKYLEYCYPNLGSLFSGSIYRELGVNNITFRVVSSVYYFFRYRWKMFHRESPINRRWLNDIAANRFSIKYLVKPYSDKTLNCLVNRGQGTDEMLKYIDQMKKLTNGNIPLENEIVERF